MVVEGRARCHAILPNTVLGIAYSGQLADEATDNSVKGSLVVKF